MRQSIMMMTVLVLVGCATQPTLDQKLAGKSPAERKQILTAECLSEARSGYARRPSAEFHKRKMTEICEKMSDEMNGKAVPHGKPE